MIGLLRARSQLVKDIAVKVPDDRYIGNPHRMWETSNCEIVPGATWWLKNSPTPESTPTPDQCE
jgi:hypothetical protein